MRVIPADGVLKPANLLGGLDVGGHVLVALGLGVNPGLCPLHGQREAVHHNHHVGVHLRINNLINPNVFRFLDPSMH